jgi:protein-S-isoprenylcysteine O-methyltransferase Ste14
MARIFVPPVITLLTITAMALLFFSFPKWNIIPFPYNFTGLLVSFYGFTIMGRSRDSFRKNNISLEFGESERLITKGIYKYSRNPMYLGMAILLLGFGICFMNLFALLLPFVFVFLVNSMHVPIEEKLLEDKFGDEYLAYKARVRRWI